MKRSEILKNRLLRLQKKRDKLNQRAMESTDAAEVRSLNDEMAEVIDEIADVQAEYDAEVEAEERSQTPPANAQVVNGGIVSGADMTLRQSVSMNPEKRDADVYATPEYRKAFMKYAQTGEAIPENLVKRDGTPANTTSLGATVPTTVLNEFINEIKKRYGNLYSRVRKLSIKGITKIPISQLQASFKWINESTVSPRQNGGEIDDFVQFDYNMAEIRVSQTLLSSIVTIDIFEREIVRIMTIAFLQAMDYGIVNGTGNGQMLGIVNDPRVTNVVSMSATDMANWTAWNKKFKSKLPLGYRDGEFIFTIGTVDSYLGSMADNNNNPVYREATGLEVNDGDAADPNGRFLGRRISLVEPEIVSDFDTASSGDVVGIFWQPNEYCINMQEQMGMRRYFDEERNEWVNKMLFVADGKVLNPKGFWLIKKA